jgi:hypothetical protein
MKGLRTNHGRSSHKYFDPCFLEMLAHGYGVPTPSAFLLHNWAVRPEDAVLPLEEIAPRVLNQEENPHAKAAEQY